MNYDILRRSGIKVSFKTKPNRSVLPTDYNNVTVEGVVSFPIANNISDVVSKWKNIQPHIPEIGTDFERSEYVIVRHTSDEVEVLALPWIEEGSIKTTSVVSKLVTIYNVPSSANAAIIQALERAGYPDVKVEDA